MVHEYIGSKITIISRNENRYEGILHSIDVDESTITLKDVRHFGTEGRCLPEIPPTPTIFEMIVFRGSDITDLAVCQTNTNFPQDSAIISVSVNEKPKSSCNRPTTDINQHAQTNLHLIDPPILNNAMEKSVQSAGVPVQNITSSNSRKQPKEQKDNNRNRNRGSNRNYHTNNHHHTTNNQRSFVVGELKPRVNQTLKAELDTEFNFSEQNKKFDKSQPLQIQIEQNNVSNQSLPVGGYSKTSGFFDSISCETLDPERTKKKSGQIDAQQRALREKQKQIDKETFGASALRSHGPSYQRGMRRSNRGRSNKQEHGS
ncbi:hypothetical protein cand_002910 [Cryptosporidium andersoni]|uniref:Lsm14-like N-terminal domain-containing protein n=1 Tax=Cryptosporidium andersoni TaxID=117008 RepID=A0A1J4MPB1_9CRYT|nr:hypothetical protein cand_002910 [Cryptosporidium andersoni]